MAIGRIIISNEIYTNHWAEIWGLMEHFRIIHIEYRHWESDLWHLHGVSDKFDDLKEGEEPPLYIVNQIKKEGKPDTYEFKRA